MLRQHYSSPITAVRQWRGYDATANVFNDVNRKLRKSKEKHLPQHEEITAKKSGS